MIQQNKQDIMPNNLGLELSFVNHNGSQIYPEMLSGYTPEEVANGVYVYANNGLLYNPEEWDTSLNDSAVGVAVITDNSRFCIKKGLGIKDEISWSTVLYGTDLPEIANSLNDYKGFNNSVAIRQAASSEDDSNNAAWYCYSQTININGNTTEGYLPSFGELLDLYDNNQSVRQTLSLIDSPTIESVVNSNFFLSSSENENNPNSFVSYISLATGSYGVESKRTATKLRYVIPFFPILPTFVDLGLPSGTKWATTNLGALTPERAGYYYQWGDVIGWTAAQVGVDKQFASDYSDYKYYSNGEFTKYNATDGKTVLYSSDDAVNMVYGQKYHIPTKDDVIELIKNTDVEIYNSDGELIVMDSDLQSEDKALFYCMNCGNFGKAVLYNRSDRSKYIEFYDFGFVLQGGNRSSQGLYQSSSLENSGYRIYKAFHGINCGSAILSNEYNDGLVFGIGNPLNRKDESMGYRYSGCQIRGVLKQ